MGERVLIKNKVLYYTKKILYWLIPVIILTIVFNRIDIEQFKHNIIQTNVSIFILGISIYPVIILIGGMRWYVTVQSYMENRLSKLFFLKNYWIGMALGIFIPASLGWDVYRIVTSSKQYGKYIVNTFAIFLEKGLALITMAVLVATLYPFVDKYIEVSSPLLFSILKFSYVSLIIFVLLIVITLIIFHNTAAVVLIRRIELVFNRFLKAAMKKIKINLPSKETKFPVQSLIAPLFHSNSYIKIILLSFSIQFVNAFKNQIFLISLGYDLPFIVNLFLVPIFFFIFLIPISFGSLGIREGTFIVFYGLFGVPPEIALIASFYNLCGIFLNMAIGGLLMFFKGKDISP